tara:strand:- start:479 stop:721 length:243 start_codon:yes stop_codon:yes gene_type:complete
MLGKHVEAVETLLSTMQEEPNAVLAENLRGLARAWDIIEDTEEDLRSVPAISGAMVRILEKMRIDDSSDIWDTITEQLTQ